MGPRDDLCTRTIDRAKSQVHGRSIRDPGLVPGFSFCARVSLVRPVRVARRGVPSPDTYIYLAEEGAQVRETLQKYGFRLFGIFFNG